MFCFWVAVSIKEREREKERWLCWFIFNQKMKDKSVWRKISVYFVVCIISMHLPIFFNHLKALNWFWSSLITPKIKPKISLFFFLIHSFINFNVNYIDICSFQCIEQQKRSIDVKKWSYFEVSKRRRNTIIELTFKVQPSFSFSSFSSSSFWCHLGQTVT